MLYSKFSNTLYRFVDAQKRKKQQQQEASGKAAKKYKEFKFWWLQRLNLTTDSVGICWEILLTVSFVVFSEFGDWHWGPLLLCIPLTVVRIWMLTGACTYTHLMAPFPGLPGSWSELLMWQAFISGEPVPERQNQSGFYWSKRQWVVMATAGPYASLHLAPDR